MLIKAVFASEVQVLASAFSRTTLSQRPIHFRLRQNAVGLTVLRETKNGSPAPVGRIRVSGITCVAPVWSRRARGRVKGREMSSIGRLLRAVATTRQAVAMLGITAPKRAIKTNCSSTARVGSHFTGHVGSR